MSSSKPHVVVFFGGDAGSNDLSQETGYWACQYIPRSRYQVTPVRIGEDGTWQVPLGSLPRRGPVSNMLRHMFAAVPNVSPRRGLERLLRQPVHSFMTFLRGRGGDDGTLHGLGSSLSVPVVGSPLSVCQQTSDKYACGRRVGDVVGTPMTRRYRQQDDVEAIVDDVREDFVPPLFVKPVSEESSVGVEEVSSPDELAAAVRRVKEAGDIMVQQRSPGTEVTVTLFDDDDGRVHGLPATVVVPRAASFYDHMAKRRAGRVTLTTSAYDGGALLEEAEDVARDVYEELGCRGLVSFDMNMGEAATELIEINTVPTFTQLTPLRQQLQRAGVHPEKMFDSLLDRSLREE